jgi:arginine deiminase
MSGLCVHNEIGRLKKVMLRRPGEELLNLEPANLDRMLFDDIPYLEIAQQEHDRFAEILRGEGIEVLYLEKLCAEALDAGSWARAEYTDRWLAESGLRGTSMLAAVKEYLDSITDTQTFVEKTIAGLRKNEVKLPRVSNTLLSDLVGQNQDSETNLLVDPMPNAYFTRDPFAIVGDGVMLNHMYSNTRSRETLVGEFIFRYHPLYRRCPQWYHRDSPYHVEGGDVLILNNHTLAIGISQRTQASAIDELAQNLFWGDEPSEVDTIYAFNIPVSRAFMHLDTVFTQIDVDKFTIHPAIMGTLQVFKIRPGRERGDVRIEEMIDTLEHVLARALGLDAVKLIPCGGGDPTAAAREQWNDGSNTLCVSPGKICVYQRNSVTNEVLYKEGLDLLVLPSAELSRGRGGPRCMSMPFEREDL